MEIITYLNSNKEGINDYLQTYFSLHLNDPILSRKKHKDAFERINQFTSRGKMIRGSLVSLGYKLFLQDSPEDLIKVGAAIELLQSALLIHDDIMDKDETRRGAPTLYKQYADKSHALDSREPEHTGISLGICAGDLAVFLGFDLLNRTETEASIYRKLVDLFSREMLIVGTAQMDDVAWGTSRALPEKKQVLELYKHKTGRYTFSLPLAAGAILAGQEGKTIEDLMELGENLGILFQIRDDELGLTGDEKKLGKPIGSDIKEGKKTLHYLQLLSRISEEERKILEPLFGNQHASEKDILLVLSMIEKYKIPEGIRNEFQEIAEKTENMINTLDVQSESNRDLLKQLYAYITKRDY